MFVGIPPAQQCVIYSLISANFFLGGGRLSPLSHIQLEVSPISHWGFISANSVAVSPVEQRIWITEIENRYLPKF